MEEVVMELLTILKSLTKAKEFTEGENKLELTVKEELISITGMKVAIVEEFRNEPKVVMVMVKIAKERLGISASIK
jgi:hypothetical protein